VIFGFLKSTPMSPRLRRLKNTALFGSLTALELKIVHGLMHERCYLPQEIVFDEGEEGQALYLVMSGHVRITRRYTTGPQLEIELEPGSFFGDLALLDSSPRSAQARAIDQCELAVFFRDDFLNLMKTDTVIGYKIALALARHLGTRLRDLIHGGRPQVEAL
jgi:CRP-like cAMP-binding protein